MIFHANETLHGNYTFFLFLIFLDNVLGLGGWKQTSIIVFAVSFSGRLALKWYLNDYVCISAELKS